MDTLAKTITAETLKTLGYVEPTKHPMWGRLSEDVQDSINESMDVMRQVAGRSAVPSMRAILDYEIRSSWWAGFMGTGLLQELSATYFAWKVRRKYRRYEANSRIPASLKTGH